MSQRSGLVDIARHFLEVHGELTRLFARYEGGELHFEDVRELVGDDAASPLFRLKERCHALFRGDGGVGHREALFDLAVGSLFHEAMKLRENLYQLEIYAPRVEALRSEAAPDSTELFQEFEKILAGATLRLGECVDETRALLAHAGAQFRVLLAHHRDDALVTRYLVKSREEVEAVFPGGLDALLCWIHGEASGGYRVAASSWLASGYFGEAAEAIAEARAHGGKGAELERLASYADGMLAYQRGDYARSLERLNDWLDRGPSRDELDCARIAVTAVGRIPELSRNEGDEALAKDARQLVQRLEPLARQAAPAA
ncbi:MAG: hypothetical protein MJE66_12000 [Proteobacteria bacterium]|nr:hypothetical protein [Pseudomonadota bacterium]